MADTPEAFAKALLARLNIKPTSANMRALVGWTRAEGGHWNNNAKYNPLNTTQPEPGAGNTGSQGNIKVYKNWHQGIDATARTLENGKYNNILKALRSGSSSQIAAAIGSSPWGTNPSLVAKTIGATKSVSSGSDSLTSLPGIQHDISSSSRTITTTDPSAVKRVALARYLTQADPNNLLLRLGAISVDEPTERTREVAVSPAALPPASRQKGAGVRLSGMSPLLELIHNGKQAFAVKNGQLVDPSVYSAVWAGHANHVHVAAGRETIIKLGKLAQHYGLTVSENPHFGGVTQGAHVPDSYHYKGEAIDASGSSEAMDKFAAAVERLYGLRK